MGQPQEDQNIVLEVMGKPGEKRTKEQFSKVREQARKTRKKL